MVIGKVNLMKWFRDTGNAFWQIRSKDKTSLISNSWEGTSDSQEEATEDLSRNLDILGPGRYNIVSCRSATPGGTKSRFNSMFELKPEVQATQAPQFTQPAFDMGQVKEMAEEIAERKMLAYRLTEMERQLQEAKEVGSEPTPSEKAWMKVLETTAPHFPQMIAGITGQPVALPAPAVAGTPEQAKPDQPSDEPQRITAALKTMYQVDPNLVDSLEKLAAMAKSNPDQYKSLLPMLNQFT